MSDTSDRPKSILVADHPGPERAVLEAVLKRLGYRVTAVESSDGLRESLEPGPVDLIIMDSRISGDQADDVSRSLSRPDRRVILVDSRQRDNRDMIGFIDITEDAIRGIGVRVPEIVFLANDLLFSRSGTPRRKRRVYGGFPARFEFESKTVQGSIYNLSAEGAFVETVEPPSGGSDVTVHFTLPSVGPFDVAARVTWRVRPDQTEGRRSPPGMGVQFIGLASEDEERIRAFVASGGHA